MQELIDRLVRPEIRELKAYHVPDASGLIKLDAMENPYAWPAELRGQWLDLLREVQLNRYPDPRGRDLQAALREAAGIPDEMDLLLGNGSDELIQMLALTVTHPGRKILSVDPGFVMYRMIGLFAGMGYVGVPLRPRGFLVGPYGGARGPGAGAAGAHLPRLPEQPDRKPVRRRGCRAHHRGGPGIGGDRRGIRPVHR